MFDEFDRLRECPELVHLLTHYADLGKVDRQVWQDRLMELEGVLPKELSKLHGKLIACDWVEQNTANVVLGKSGVVAACYRVMRDGVRALRRLGVGADAVVEEEEEVETPVPVEEKKPRRKREPKPVPAAESKPDEIVVPMTAPTPREATEAA